MATATDFLVRADYRSAETVVSFAEAKQLAAQHGSPLLVISRSAVRRNYETLRSALPGVEFFYAAKANSDRHLLETLEEVGCSIDVCTFREMQYALQAGFTPERMIHTHPCKRPQDIVDCYELGLRWFTFDNVNELPKLAAHAPDANLLLRLAAPSISSVINLSAKFGAAAEDARGLIAAAIQRGQKVRGLSFHVGSQCLSGEDFIPALTIARRVWDQATEMGCPLEVLDIGGGLPAPYRSAVLTLDAYCRPLTQALSDLFGDLPVRIIAEPGRVMCADTTTLISSVVGKSVRSGLPWYYLDDGIYGSFSGKAFDHADFPLLVEAADQREVSACVVAGPTCDSGDVISRDQYLPDLEIGELVLVPTMGAYSSASATDFNGLLRAGSIAVE